MAAHCSSAKEKKSTERPPYRSVPPGEDRKPGKARGLARKLDAAQTSPAMSGHLGVTGQALLKLHPQAAWT
jgi:hypothetical protein